jgi:ABC-type proline/glycine betaine transport system substrate-binding protein
MAMASIRILFLAALAAIAGMIDLGEAHAQAIAQGKPIRIIVGFAAGGAADIVTRVLAAKLGDSLGQNAIVENRTGGGGNIATEAVARAEPDGTTLLMAPLSNAVNETLAAGRQAIDLKLVDQLGDEKAAVAWLVAEKKIKSELPVRDYKLNPRFGDLTFLRTAASITLDALGLGSIARRVEQAGVVQAVDRLGLDGMLALWHPGGAN